jgi:hypothetical protein
VAEPRPIDEKDLLQTFRRGQRELIDGRTWLVLTG